MPVIQNKRFLEGIFRGGRTDEKKNKSSKNGEKTSFKNLFLFFLL